MKSLNIGFINPPHADWSLANNIAYLQFKSHYQRNGKYPQNVNWIPAPYKWNVYTDYSQIWEEIKQADILLFSSYAWNYLMCDELALYAKSKNPNVITVIGGPHIGTHEPELMKKRRSIYNLICQPTKPGEVFVEELIDQWFEESINREEISWEIDSKKTRVFTLDQDYSVYEDNIDYLKEARKYAQENKIEPFMVLETTRGCPYKCVYCEWGGGIGTKIYKKPIPTVEKDVLALKEAGYREVYFTDANFGIFMDRDLHIYKYGWDNGVYFTDISSFKSKDLEKRKKLIDACFEVVGRGPEKNLFSDFETDMWDNTAGWVSVLPTVSLQSVSDEAMKVANRIDLSYEDKIKLSEYIHQKAFEHGYPTPGIELIFAMPGSTIDDFYKEFEVIWNFRSPHSGLDGWDNETASLEGWNSFRHDYMFLPDSVLNSEEYKKKYNIETVEVYSDIFDEDGIDNINSLYRNKRTYFKTIRSCYSFTSDELIEMWFMNHGGIWILKNLYKDISHKISPSDFARMCFTIISGIPEYKSIENMIKDIYDPSTEPKSIRRLGSEYRVKVIEDFLERYKTILKSEAVSKILLGGNDAQ